MNNIKGAVAFRRFLRFTTAKINKPSKNIYQPNFIKNAIAIAGPTCKMFTIYIMSKLNCNFYFTLARWLCYGNQAGLVCEPPGKDRQAGGKLRRQLVFLHSKNTVAHSDKIRTGVRPEYGDPLAREH